MSRPPSSLPHPRASPQERKERAMQEIERALAEIKDGEIIITVQGGNPIHVKATKFVSNKRIG